MRRSQKHAVITKAFGAETEALGDRQIRVVISTGQIDRSGDVVVQAGINLTNYNASRTVLWNHDQNHPVAACVEIEVKGGRLTALVQFPPEGVSEKADEVYGLLKAGVINAASIGFLPLDVEPVDGKNPRKGLRFDTSELLEFSFVSVPANPGAQVMQRRVDPMGAPAMSIKGLYAVAALAQLLGQLGYQVEDSRREAVREGDGSTVPGQLKDALGQLGAALIAMTTEEVGELLADGEDDDNGDVMMNSLRGLVAKSGRKFSKATASAMQGHMQTIADAHGKIGDAHGAMVKMLAEDPEGPLDDSEEEKRIAGRTKAQQRRCRELEILAL